MTMLIYKARMRWSSTNTRSRSQENGRSIVTSERVRATPDATILRRWWWWRRRWRQLIMLFGWMIWEVQWTNSMIYEHYHMCTIIKSTSSKLNEHCERIQCPFSKYSATSEFRTNRPQSTGTEMISSRNTNHTNIIAYYSPHCAFRPCCEAPTKTRIFDKNVAV